MLIPMNSAIGVTGESSAYSKGNSRLYNIALVRSVVYWPNLDITYLYWNKVEYDTVWGDMRDYIAQISNRQK